MHLINTRYIIVFLLSFLGLQGLEAQSIVLKGRVTDADTKEGLPFSNVYFDGTTKGITTDLDGYYEWEIRPPHDTLTVSALSFAPRSKIIPKGQKTVVMNFILESQGLDLDEIVVLAGENPANILMRKVLEYKPINDVNQSVPAFHFEQYSKLELDMENLSDDFINNRWMKPFDFIFDNIDSTSDEKPFLPFYIQETVAEVYHVQDEKEDQIVIKAEQTSGIDNNTVVEYIKGIHKDFNLYENWITVLGKNFASPFGDAGLFYYEYYIIDSAYINHKWCRKLKFKPKRKQENTFYGDFWIADSSFALVRANMRMSPEVNINLVNRIIIFQDYEHNNVGDLWYPKTRKMVVDFNIDKEGMGIIGRQTRTFRDFVFEPPSGLNLSEADKLNRQTNFDELDDEAWGKLRHVPLSQTEEIIYSMVDSIKKVPIYKTYVQVIETIFSGYIGNQAGKLQFGTPYSLYSFNEEEGHRFRLGFRTTAKWNKIVQFKGSLAYGLRDKKWKYSLFSQVILQRNPRIKIGAQHISDISLNSENSEAFLESNLFSGSFRRPILQKLIRVKESRIFYEHGWGGGISHKMTVLHRKLEPINNSGVDQLGFNFAYLKNPEDFTAPDSTINTTELIWKFRWAEGEKFYEDGFLQLSTGTSKPIFAIQYTLGLSKPFGDFSYHKVEINYRHWIDIPPIGWLEYRVRAGKFFGQAPFLLMGVHPGNESYFITRSRFNLMNRYEFASDIYTSWILIHHFDGVFLNKIPLIRKLKWRTVASLKGVIGGMSTKNKAANQLNIFSGPSDNYSGFRVPDKKPYLEAGIGIENIFKVIRIDALWRLSYLDNSEVSGFAIGFGLDFHF